MSSVAWPAEGGEEKGEMGATGGLYIICLNSVCVCACACDAVACIKNISIYVLFCFVFH